MAKCFVLRANIDDASVNVSATLRGFFGDDKAVELAKKLLNEGAYRMTTGQGYIGDAEDSEAVFDALNTSGDSYMTLGDVIVWNNGKRELCLAEGWACI